MFKNVDGEQIALTDDELSELNARDAAWADGAPARLLSAVRAKRNALLSASDFVMLSDSPMSNQNAWQTYRQSLRDLTKNLANVTDINQITWPTDPTKIEGSN